MFSTNEILSTPFSNDSCEPDCFLLGKAEDVNVVFTPKFICSFLVIIFVITISIVVIFRHFQHSKKQQRKRKEGLQVRKYFDFDKNRFYMG